MVRHKDFYQKYKTTNPIAAGKHRAPRSSFVEELDKARNPELKARSNSVLSDEAFRSVVHYAFNLKLLPDNRYPFVRLTGLVLTWATGWEYLVCQALFDF